MEDSCSIWEILSASEIKFNNQRNILVGDKKNFFADKVPEKTVCEFPLIERIKRYIEMNCDKSLRIKEIADCFQISVSYMLHQFKVVTGMTVIDYKIKCRIFKAMILLNDTDKGITEVAYDCGYSSHSFFSTQFKNALGISPTEYRKIMRITKSDNRLIFENPDRYIKNKY